MVTRAATVFDLFHTLVDPEPLLPDGFDAITEVAGVCGLEPTALREFWSLTYVERETTEVELVDLVRRYSSTSGTDLTAQQAERVDEIFGVGKDDALRSPDPAIVRLVAACAARNPIGVLSNCHEREVRAWDSSPLARHVMTFGRSSRIGAMKPDPGSYGWVIDRLGADPASSMYVGNGSSDELLGARDAGFGTIVHCNVYDRTSGLVPAEEQRRRAGQADQSVDSIADLTTALGL